MKGEFPIFMLYSARIQQKYKGLNVSHLIKALKYLSSILKYLLWAVLWSFDSKTYAFVLK